MNVYMKRFVLTRIEIHLIWMDSLIEIQKSYVRMVDRLYWDLLG